jgi:hypothetical protein
LKFSERRQFLNDWLNLVDARRTVNLERGFPGLGNTRVGALGERQRVMPRTPYTFSHHHMHELPEVSAYQTARVRPARSFNHGISSWAAGRPDPVRSKSLDDMLGPKSQWRVRSTLQKSASSISRRYQCTCEKNYPVLRSICDARIAFGRLVRIQQRFRIVHFPTVGPGSRRF